MPKNPVTATVQRWQALDAALGSREGMHLEAFARRWRVSTKTVRRDLEDLAELGRFAEDELDGQGRRVWRYGNDEDFLFAANLRRRPQGAPVCQKCDQWHRDGHPRHGAG
jgi:hypothetical protein